MVTITPKAEEPALIVKETNEAMKAARSVKINAKMMVAFGAATPTTSQITSISDGHNSYETWGGKQYLTYNDKVYSRANDKDAWKLDPSMSASGPSTDFLGDIKQPSGTTLELFNGTLCQVITGDTTDKNGTVTHYKIWIGLLDHLVRRYDSDSNGTNFSVQSTATYYDYNVPVSIPKPWLCVTLTLGWRTVT